MAMERKELEISRQEADLSIKELSLAVKEKTIEAKEKGARADQLSFDLKRLKTDSRKPAGSLQEIAGREQKAAAPSWKKPPAPRNRWPKVLDFGGVPIASLRGCIRSSFGFFESPLPPRSLAMAAHAAAAVSFLDAAPGSADA